MRNKHEEPAVFVIEETYPGIRQHIPHCTIHQGCRQDFEKAVRRGGRIKESSRMRLTRAFLDQHFRSLASRILEGRPTGVPTGILGGR